jgi:acetyl esterase/lipase
MQVIHDITYAEYSGQSLQLDLYLPDASTRPAPLVLYIVGGGWRSSPKAGAHPWLQEAGFAAANMRYRLSTQAVAPANIYDCLAALRWLRANAENYGFDAERIGVWGSSAGGHLAALVGSWPQQDSEVSPRVRAVADFCGPTDLTRIGIPEIRAQFAALYEVSTQYLGGPVEEKSELARKVSPLTYVSKNLPPTFIAHCRGDAVVPVEESEIYYEALKNAGVDATLRVLENDSHAVPVYDVMDDFINFWRRTLMNHH